MSTEDRQAAIAWWSTPSYNEKLAITSIHLPERLLRTLTGREIEKMWKATIK